MFTNLAPAIAGQPGISFAPIVADIEAGLKASLEHLEQALAPKPKRVRRKAAPDAAV